MYFLSKHNIIGVTIFSIGLIVQSVLNLTILTYLINPLFIAITNPYMIVVWDNLLGKIPKNKFFSKYFFYLIICFVAEFLMWNITKPDTVQVDITNGIGFVYIILSICFLAFIIQYLIAFYSTKKNNKILQTLLLLIIPVAIFVPVMFILFLTITYGLGSH